MINPKIPQKIQLLADYTSSTVFRSGKSEIICKIGHNSHKVLDDYKFPRNSEFSSFSPILPALLNPKNGKNRGFWCFDDFWIPYDSEDVEFCLLESDPHLYHVLDVSTLNFRRNFRLFWFFRLICLTFIQMNTLTFNFTVICMEDVSVEYHRSSNSSGAVSRLL